MSTGVQWFRFDKEHTYVRRRNARGTPTSQKAFPAGYEGPVTRAELESAEAAGAGSKIPTPAGKGTDKSGKAVDREAPEDGKEA